MLPLNVPMSSPLFKNALRVCRAQVKAATEMYGTDAGMKVLNRIAKEQPDVFKIIKAEGVGNIRKTSPQERMAQQQQLQELIGKLKDKGYKIVQGNIIDSHTIL